VLGDDDAVIVTFTLPVACAGASIIKATRDKAEKALMMNALWMEEMEGLVGVPMQMTTWQAITPPIQPLP